VIDFNRDEKGCYTDHGVSGYAVAVKLSRREMMGDEFVRNTAEEMMLAIAEKCSELGARTIGHIKSHVRTESGTIKADTIGVLHGAYSSGKFLYPVKDLYMAINSVVHGIPEEAVKAATLEGIHEIAEKYRMTVVREKEHAYFDEFDFVLPPQNGFHLLEAQFAGEDFEDDI